MSFPTVVSLDFILPRVPLIPLLELLAFEELLLELLTPSLAEVSESSTPVACKLFALWNDLSAA